MPKMYSFKSIKHKTLAYVLDTMNIEYKILSNTEADIFEKVNISKLTTELSKKIVKLFRYMNMMKV